MSRYADRIDDLARRARADREVFDQPADPPDEERAIGYLREGFGRAVGVYLDARTGGPPVRFERTEFERLEAAMNTWLSLYARCHAVRIEPDVTVRTAAEALLDTHDVRETAAVLTGVPARDAGDGREHGAPATGD
jgi:hypothetical protein